MTSKDEQVAAVLTKLGQTRLANPRRTNHEPIRGLDAISGPVGTVSRINAGENIDMQGFRVVNINATGSNAASLSTLRRHHTNRLLNLWSHRGGETILRHRSINEGVPAWEKFRSRASQQIQTIKPHQAINPEAQTFGLVPPSFKTEAKMDLTYALLQLSIQAHRATAHLGRMFELWFLARAKTPAVEISVLATGDSLQFIVNNIVESQQLLTIEIIED